MAKDPGLRAESAAAARALVTWAAGARGTTLPEPVRRRAALILADDVGAMVAGAQESQVAAAQAALARLGRPAREATVFAPGAPRLDRTGAAGSNGLAVTWCELDEGFRNASCHAGAYTLPTLLAEAEAREIGTGELLSLLAVAYEVTTRFALAYPFARFNVHPHAAWATVGAAAAASLARGHDPETMLLALTGAASMTFAGPFDTAVEGALVRNAWTCTGSWIGLRAADWAEIGIGGLPETPYDVLVDCLGTGCRPGELTEELGSRWSVSHGYHKVFACCGYAHSAVTATLDFMARPDRPELESIVAIEVETGPGGRTLTTVSPDTVLAAKFSIPHAVAATMAVGDAGRRAFTEGTLRDPLIARLRERVSLADYPDLRPAPKDRPARITWRTGDGREWSALCESARGGADQPFDDATLLSKLRDNAGGVFPALPDALWRIVEGDPAALRLGWADCVAAATGRDAADWAATRPVA